MKIVPIALISAVAGSLIALACSDDSPSADAATCDCPASEPPITRARIHRVEDTATIAPNTGDAARAECPANEVLVSGGCYVAVDNSAGRMVLLESVASPLDPAMQPTSWRCAWRNDNGSGSAEVRAQAICLKPAP